MATLGSGSYIAPASRRQRNTITWAADYKNEAREWSRQRISGKFEFHKELEKRFLATLNC